MPDGFGQAGAFIDKGFPTLQAFKDARDGHNTLVYTFHKTTSSMTTTETFGASWRLTFRPPAGSSPASTPGTQYNNTTGGIIFPDYGKRKFIEAFYARTENNADGCFFLMDRLVAVGGIVITSTGVKTVNSLPLLRYINGEGVMAYIEIDVAGATTIPQVNLSSYTNQDGTPGRVGGTFTYPSSTTAINNILGPLPLQAGDTGVRSVESLEVTVASTTTGTCNVVLGRMLHMTGLSAAEFTEYRAPLPYIDMERLYNGATLMPLIMGYSGVETIIGVIKVVLEE